MALACFWRIWKRNSVDNLCQNVHSAAAPEQMTDSRVIKTVNARIHSSKERESSSTRGVILNYQMCSWSCGWNILKSFMLLFLYATASLKYAKNHTGAFTVQV